MPVAVTPEAFSNVEYDAAEIAALADDLATKIGLPSDTVIEIAVDDTLLQAIAIEHRRGRRLFVGTTNLDAQRLVVWNMGAIAASGHPQAAQLPGPQTG